MAGSWRRHALPLVTLALALSGLAACSGAADDQDAFPKGLPCLPRAAPGAAPEAGASFDPDHMLCVQVRMKDADLDKMRFENRFGDPTNAIGAALSWIMGDCGEDLPDGYQWYSADVAIDGAELAAVGIRKKGFLGSLSSFKPSIKLKTDRHVPGQKLGDTERLTLNNGSQDKTRMATCLTYRTFALAGHPAPRCNLANVTLNGLPRGAYTHVEALKKPFLKRAFGNDSGSLYEGTIADFIAGSALSFSPGHLGRWEAKTDATDPSGEPIRRVYEALQVPDEALLASLEPVLNVPRFYTFWALEALVNHTDSYSGMRNNFYVYFDPDDGGRATFVPWGPDNTFNDSDGKGAGAGLQGFTHGELTRRLSRIPAGALAFERELQRLLDEVWDEQVLLADLERFGAQVRTAQEDGGHAAALATTRDWIAGRRAVVQSWLARGLPPGKASAPSCQDGPGPDGLFPAFGLAALFKDVAFGM